MKSSTPTSVEPADTPSGHELDEADISGLDAWEAAAETEAAEAEALAAAARERARRLRVQSEPSVPENQSSRSTSPPRRRLRRLVISAAFASCTFITMGAVAANAWMVIQHRDALASQQRSAEFAAAARQGVITLMSMDHANAKQAIQRIVDDSTGDFRADLTQSADDFTAIVQGSQVVTTAEVNATAVQSMTNDSAVVLVSAVSHVSNNGGADNAPRLWRLRVTVQRDGGQIKMAKIEFVP